MEEEKQLMSRISKNLQNEIKKESNKSYINKFTPITQNFSNIVVDECYNILEEEYYYPE